VLQVPEYWKKVSMTIPREDKGVSTHKERPHSPCCRQDDKAGGHSSLDEFEFLLCSNLLGHQDTSAIGSNNALERRDEQCEWQSRLISIVIKMEVGVIVLTLDTR
jgi:hypothetical protein